MQTTIEAIDPMTATHAIADPSGQATLVRLALGCDFNPMPSQIRYPTGNPRPFQPGRMWWLGQLLLTGAAGLFVWFGVALLVASYQLDDPFSFVMTFFSASLIILVSCVLALGLILRMRRLLIHKQAITTRAGSVSQSAHPDTDRDPARQQDSPVDSDEVRHDSH